MLCIVCDKIVIIVIDNECVKDPGSTHAKYCHGFYLVNILILGCKGFC